MIAMVPEPLPEAFPGRNRAYLSLFDEDDDINTSRSMYIGGRAFMSFISHGRQRLLTERQFFSSPHATQTPGLLPLRPRTERTRLLYS